LSPMDDPDSAASAVSRSLISFPRSKWVVAGHDPDNSFLLPLACTGN
jgi:hypothetical protein